MSLQTIITAILIILVIAWVTNYTKKKSKQIDVLPDGKRVLKSHIIYGILGYLLLLTFMFFVGLGFYFNWDLETTDSWKDFIFPFLLMAGILYLAVYTTSYYYKHKLLFDSDEIIIINAWGNSKSMKWDELKDVEFNNMMQEITLHAKDGKKLKFSCILYGVDVFKAEFVKHHPFMIEKFYS